MTLFRRVRSWWPVALVGLIALVVYAAWPGRSTFTVGPETTYITEPLDAEGNVDYQTALNERMGRGITPETNANVLIWQALGPRPEGNTMPPEYFKWLGIEQPPEEGEYFIDQYKYFDAHLKDRQAGVWDWLFDEQADPQPPDLTGEDYQREIGALAERKQRWYNRVDRARQWPWTAKDDPDVAAWLKRNEKPLALVVEASKRPHYFNPLVSKDPSRQSARLINAVIPSVQKCRAVAAALACRAMSRVGNGDFNGAWHDLLACQRLGRLVGHSGTLIESLVGIALAAIGTDGQLILLSHGRHSSKQLLMWLEDLRALPPFPPMADKMDLCERFWTLDALMSIACRGARKVDLLDHPGSPPSEYGFWDRLFTDGIDWDPAFRNVNRTYDRLGTIWRLPDRAARTQEFANMVDEVTRAKSAATNIGFLNRTALSNGERGEIIANILIALMLPALDKVQNAADRTEQTQGNLHVAFALAAFRADAGRYPARLDELAPKYLPRVPGDLFSGGPLIYRPTETGYLLYSVGVNGLDEDGRWMDDDPRGDDLRVRMPVAEPAAK